MIRLAAVLLLVACTTQADLTVPVSGTSTPPTTTVWTGDTATLLPSTTVVDYDAEWKAFVRETLAVHAQKPEHPFWSAARTVPALSTPTTVAASTVPPTPPTLEELVANYFEPGDQAWALRVAFCESPRQ